jgi:uncharacterized membrane protein YraQ (UPF0718 family)
MDGAFHFSLSDFSFAFLSILLEGLPFLLLGTIISGLIDQFLPARLMARLLPRNPYAGALVSGLLGLIFPMCECGVVPIIRRLMAKGLPASKSPSCGLAWGMAWRWPSAWPFIICRCIGSCDRT